MIIIAHVVTIDRSLRNNIINGTLDFGDGYSSQLQLVDLQKNYIDAVTQRAGQTVEIM